MTMNGADTVLLVEDNTVDAKLVQILLATRGNADTCLEVVDRLSAALERLEAGGIDVILLDLGLPDSSGLPTFLRMRDAFPNVPIIVVTGTTDEGVAAEAMRRGAQDFLVKGTIDGRSLVRSIRYAVERQRAHNRIRSNEERYRNILNASHDAIYLSTSVGDLVDFNDAAEELFGYQRAELTGMNLRSLCVEPAKWELLEARVARGQVVKDCELRLRRSDDTKIDCLVTCVVRHDEAGGQTGYQGTIRDITERKKLQHDLAQAQKLESIGSLAAGIAHEINTPIQYVSDNARFLTDAFAKIQPVLASYRAVTDNGGDDSSLSNDEIEFLLEQIPGALAESLDGLDRVATIVRAMKEFSHPGSQDARPVDINNALESTVTVSRNEWKYVADIVTDLDPVLPAVPGHVNQLNQVFLNIIVNAAHAIDDSSNGAKGTITLSTKLADDHVEVRIADDGTGIPEEVRSKIFDPFFTTKDVGKGTGQGLSVARSVIVDKHEGTIEVESELGQGTTFVIRLPVAAVKAPQPAAVGP